MKTLLYSPNQILAAGFLGGPLACLYALKYNYDALANRQGAQAVVRWGVAFLIALASCLPFLQQSFPPFVLPVAYSFAARAIAQTTQRRREQIAGDENLDFIPTGRLIGSSVVCMLVFMLAVLVWLGVLAELGLVQLPDPAALEAGVKAGP